MEEKYGEVEEMNVCDNLGDHLVGNVYVKVGLRRQLGPRSEACLPHLSEQALCSSWVIGLPTLAASLAVERWALECLGSVLAVYRLNFSVACGVIWGSEIEPVSPALQGRFLTTGPPGKLLYLNFSLELPKT